MLCEMSNVVAEQADLPAQTRPTHKRSTLRRVFKWLLAAGVILVVLAGAVVATGYWFIRRSWPQVEGTVSVANLQSPTRIIRDRWGTSHIYAESAHDLFFSQGYAQAQDRMWQMEFTRRIGSGRLSEVLGDGPIDVDRLTRTLGLRRSAQRDWDGMGGEDRSALEAYAGGVDAYLQKNRGRLSIEFRIFGVDPEPWTPVDSLTIVKLMSWILSENASIQVSRARIIGKSDESVACQILPPYTDGAELIVAPEADGYSWLGPQFRERLKSVAALLGTEGPTQGSNSWVIAAGRTSTGRPILANDTHLDLFIPSVWYANGLHGGGFDVVGYSLAGAPGVTIGHNGRVAWGLTDLVADVQDVYIEKLDNEPDPTRYKFRGELRPLDIVSETIQMKDASPVTMKVARTHHGPLVNEWIDRFNDSRPLAISWASENSSGLIRSLLLLNRANNWGEFRDALSLWDGPNLSFVYADVDGNIGYQAAGRIPVRASKNQGVIPEPGWTGEYEWKENIPFAALPYSFNPAKGFIVTANQKPVSDDYPYRLGYEFADPFRAARITYLLSENSRVSVDDSERMQGDTYHLPAESLRPYLVSVTPANDLEAKAVEAVRTWNLHCDPDEPGAAIYQVWYRYLVEDTVGDELGPELTTEYLEFYWIHGPVMMKLVREEMSRLFDDVTTPETESRDDMVQRSLKQTVAWLSARFGSDPREWRWGRFHTMKFQHRPFGMTEVPVVSRLFNYGPMAAPGGDRFTVNATWFTWDDPENPFSSDGGAAQRIIMDLSDWDRSVGVNSTGQSEQLFYEHRDDMVSLWRDLKYHPMLFSETAIQAESRSELKLVPSM